MNVSILHLKYKYGARTDSHFHVLLPLLLYMVLLNIGNCPLIMPIIKGCCASDALPHTFNIGMLESLEKNSATIKHIDNESTNIIIGYNVAFHTNDYRI